MRGVPAKNLRYRLSGESRMPSTPSRSPSSYGRTPTADAVSPVGDAAGTISLVMKLIASLVSFMKQR
ncbi:hypothetical protein GCM10010151_55300 [Actinoallomurus spadix]|uniref:Uncharacterized protein n=1 Tax=Actinoallomurus spadix TaxID=79912 RepID=A0ABN0XA69_9ACTN